MYSLQDFGFMIGPQNEARVAAYYEAMKRVITPESVVLEIGTGVGLFAMLACQLGARHVYAIESNKMIDLAAELAEANGFGSRITFIKDLSTNVTLPEKADVMISDIRGTLPWFSNHIACIVDARKRLLRPGGVQIPGKDMVYLAAVHQPKIYDKYCAPWVDNRYGLDFSGARRRVVNQISRKRFTADDLLTSPQAVATLDYYLMTEDGMVTTITMPVTEAGVGHGFAFWFDSELAAGVSLLNAPGQRYNAMYGHPFFPWENRVSLEKGDQIVVALRAHRRPNNLYGWRWSTTVTGAEGQIKASFKQGTYFSRVEPHPAVLRDSPN